VLESKRILKRRADWRLGRWTAKQALRMHNRQGNLSPDYNEIEIRAAADGAPEAFLHGRPLPVTLSLSHSHGLGLCTVAGLGYRTGCDVEYVEKRSDAFIDDYFAETERNTVRDAAPALRALVTTLIWSAKESALKAMREGLRRDPRDVVIEVPNENPRDEWATFVARDRKAGETFDGWWRASGAHVYTMSMRSTRRCARNTNA